MAGNAAAQSASARVYGDYVSHGGQINPCIHTSEQLKTAQREITPDIEQYAPDYPAAIAAALEARARGDCAGKKPLPNVAPPVTKPPVSAPPVATPIPTPVPTAIPMKTVVPEPPAPMVVAVATPDATATKPEDVRLERVSVAAPANDAPAPVLILGLLAAVLATAALFLTSMRRLGWADERMAPVRHAWGEAGWRADALWGDFRDWLRLGR